MQRNRTTSRRWAGAVLAASAAVAVVLGPSTTATAAAAASTAPAQRRLVVRLRCIVSSSCAARPARGRGGVSRVHTDSKDDVSTRE